MFKNKYRPYLVIILLGLALYLATAFFDFSYLDDNTLILDNYSIISQASQIGSFFTNDVFFSDNDFYYRPLLSISLFFDTLISGQLPWFFHVSNVLLHILAACLLFALLKKLKSPAALAFWLTLIFLAHPALVQSVAWIPGRNDSILAIFVTASFIYFLKFLEKPRLADYTASLLFFSAALFTKETALVFPVLALFYYLFISEKKINIADKWSWIVGATAGILIWTFFRSLAVNGGSGLSVMVSSILANSPALIVGLGRFFLPFDLAIMSVLKDANLVFGLLAVIILAAAAIYKKGIPKKYLAFGLLWYLLFLLPSLINPDSRNAYYFLEHRLYLPFIGLLIMTAQIKFLKDLDYRRPSVYASGLALVILFFMLSAFHLPNFQNRLAFWQSAVASSPSAPMPVRNLGVMLYFNNRQTEALAAYTRALELNPEEPMAHNNIGVIYLGQGKLDEAEAEFKKELEINPGYDRALANLQDLLILKNQLR
ncbi:MAG: glycosyltransferase family 39 protein [Candidatus Falkowbacteria bacterium]|nr:MAG: glycosyltransferase family 39 protein [Candidatus Falkowbacteria bacterium]